MINTLDKFDKAISFKSLLCILTVFLMLLPVTVIGVDANTVDNSGEETPIIVSLGDSFSSGEGIEKFYGQELDNKEKVKSEDWLAHRSQKSWPGMLEIPGLDGKTKEHKDIYWYFRAVSGAETKHLNSRQSKDYSIGIFGDPSGTAKLPAQLDVFGELPAGSVDYVTLTLGGNDAGFTSIITEAVTGSTYLETSKLSDKLSDVWKKFFAKDGIRDDLYKSYKDIEAAAGAQAQIIVAGYPRLLNAEGKGAFFSLDEASEINRAVSNFDIEIEKLVERCSDEGMKICFVSVEEAFAGHEAYSNNAYINKVILGSEPEELKNFVVASAYSMHPNENGAAKYAECVNEKIKQLAAEEEARLEEEALNPSAKDREVVLVLDGGDVSFVLCLKVITPFYRVGEFLA